MTPELLAAFDPHYPFRGDGELGLFLPSAYYGVDIEGIADAIAGHGSFYPSMHFSWQFDQVNHEIARPLYMQASSQIVASPWGVQFNRLPPHIPLNVGDWREPELAVNTDRLVAATARLGAKWMRFSINWSTVQDAAAVTMAVEGVKDPVLVDLAAR